jgi:hypothetical protein
VDGTGPKFNLLDLVDAIGLMMSWEIGEIAFVGKNSWDKLKCGSIKLGL